jgi:site-specific recombinase XerD
MNILQIIEYLSKEFIGHNALIQIQIDGQYIVKRIGDINQLVDNPTMVSCVGNSSFLDWMAGEIGKETFTPGTIANHKATLAVLRKFKSNMTFVDIDYKCICDFDNFLKGEGYAINTIAKFMKIFRRFVNLAIDEEMMTSYPFRKYHIKTENVQKQSLTERELHRIENKVAEENMTEEENKIIKSFLFSAYSGLRFSDVLQITKQHIKTIYRNKWVVMRMQKTDHEVRIPISKMFSGKATSIIQENRTTTGRLFQLPCNARCNLILHRVLKRFGIHRHITFHCARHTCATILLSKGVSLSVIQHILGHQSIKTTQVYSAVKDTTINKEIKRAFR